MVYLNFTSQRDQIELLMRLLKLFNMGIHESFRRSPKKYNENLRKSKKNIPHKPSLLYTLRWQVNDFTIK
jgi:hypothetical protein